MVFDGWWVNKSLPGYKKMHVFGWQNMAATFYASHPGLSMDPCIYGHLQKMNNGVGSLSDANMSRKAS